MLQNRINMAYLTDILKLTKVRSVKIKHGKSNGKIFEKIKKDLSLRF